MKSDHKDIIDHFSLRSLNGGSLIERSLLCRCCDAEWEGFYENTELKCAKEAYASGWRVKEGKVKCSQCSENN